MIRKAFPVLALFLLSLLAGCGEGNSKKYIASGGEDGEYYGYTEKLVGKLNSNKDDKEYNILSTAGSVENLKLLSNKSVKYAIVQSDSIKLEDVKRYNIKLVSPLFAEGIYIFSLSDGMSDKKELCNMKSIAVGIEGSGQLVTAERVIDRLCPGKAKIERRKIDIYAAIGQLMSPTKGENNVDAVVFVASEKHRVVEVIKDLKITPDEENKLQVNIDKIFDVVGVKINDKTLEDISSVYPTYQNNEGGTHNKTLLAEENILLFKQSALLVTLANSSDTEIESMLISIKEINDEDLKAGGNNILDTSDVCVGKVPFLPLHDASANYIADICKKSNDGEIGISIYAYFVFYLISSLITAFLLIWLAIFNKTSFFKKGVHSDRYGVMAWVVSHKIFSYSLIFLSTLYVAALCIKGIEINSSERFNIDTDFGEKPISDIVMWLIFVISTGLDHGEQPINSLSNIILIIQQLLLVIGMPISILATSWDVIEQFFTGRVGIATNKLSGHIVFVGWKDSFSNLINNILALRPSQKIAIISTQKGNPIIDHSLPLNNVGFINKSPVSEKALSFVSIDKCNSVIINVDGDSVDVGVPFIVERLTDNNKAKLYLISDEPELKFNSGRVKSLSRQDGFKEFILNIQIKFSSPVAQFLRHSIDSALSHEKYAHSLLNERFITPENSWSTSKAMNIASIRNKFGYTSIQHIFMLDDVDSLKMALIDFSSDLLKVNIKLLGVVVNCIIDNEEVSFKIYSPFERDIDILKKSDNFEVLSLSIFFVLRRS